MSMFKSLIDNVKEMLYSEEYMEQSKIRKVDFTRMRKMSFPDNVLLILKGTKHGLQAGLNEFFASIETDKETYSKQAFSKGRLRIKPEAFLELFKATVCKFYKEATIKTYRGYRVTAIDGSRYTLPNTPELRSIYGEQITKGQSQVQALTSCLYDVLNHMLMDVRIYPCKSNERIIAEEHLASLDSFIRSTFPFERTIFAVLRITAVCSFSFFVCGRMPQNSAGLADKCILCQIIFVFPRFILSFSINNAPLSGFILP